MGCGCPLIGPCMHPGTSQCECDQLRRDHERRHRIQQAPVTTVLQQQQHQQRFIPDTPNDEELLNDPDDFLAGM